MFVSKTTKLTFAVVFVSVIKKKKKLQIFFKEMNMACLLGDSGGVVNSLDFCLASLKSLGCFYFRCILSSQWKVVTVNLRILHCQL